jgi:hypothetical protein
LSLCLLLCCRFRDMRRDVAVACPGAGAGIDSVGGDSRAPPKQQLHKPSSPLKYEAALGCLKFLAQVLSQESIMALLGPESELLPVLPGLLAERGGRR